MATSVTGLSADWLAVSFSDTCTTKDEMFVTAGLSPEAGSRALQ